ncbi:hypothetical protein HOY80DRAFT_263523 [Tuber brumale]|nr:hypothetical protein HOY80DRAFT_263523 [Tuber brumale]
MIRPGVFSTPSGRFTSYRDCGVALILWLAGEHGLGIHNPAESKYMFVPTHAQYIIAKPIIRQLERTPARPTKKTPPRYRHAIIMALLGGPWRTTTTSGRYILSAAGKLLQTPWGRRRVVIEVLAFRYKLCFLMPKRGVRLNNGLQSGHTTTNYVFWFCSTLRKTRIDGKPSNLC